MKDKKKKGNGIFKEFVAFINKGNALALAIGVIIGGAFSAIVTAINKSIISPIIARLVGDADLSKSLLTPLKQHTASATEFEALQTGSLVGTFDATTGQVYDIYISWGAFIQAVIDFLLIAIILFAIVKIVTSIVKHAKAASEKLHKKEEAEAVEAAPAPAPAPVEDPADVKLLKEIRDLLKDNKTSK